MNKPRPMTVEEVELLERLLVSPVFTALKAMMDLERYATFSLMLTAKEPSVLFNLQGRIAGLYTLEQLPEILVKQKQERAKKTEKQEQTQKKEEDLRMRQGVGEPKQG